MGVVVLLCVMVFRNADLGIHTGHSTWPVSYTHLDVYKRQVFESMKEATGIDLSEIINADSYDAKVNRNVNVTGLDGVNPVSYTHLVF